MKTNKDVLEIIELYKLALKHSAQKTKLIDILYKKLKTLSKEYTKLKKKHE